MDYSLKFTQYFRSFHLIPSRFSSAIKACGKAGKWKEALDLLREMEEEGGVAPNIRTYTAGTIPNSSLSLWGAVGRSVLICCLP